MSGPRPGLMRAGSSIAVANKTIVLVTGANSGIGFEIVKSLASLRSDYQILLGCRNVSKGEQAAASMGAPLNVNPIQLDIANDASIEHCFKTIDQLFGRLDILINNATSTGNDLIEDGHDPTPRQLWNHVYNLNAISTGILTERLLPLLEHSKMPKIIFMSNQLSSISMLQAAGKPLTPALLPYVSSKSAVNMMAMHYALSYPHFRVNASCPGPSVAEPGSEVAEASDPAKWASQVVRLATEINGPTGTFTTADGAITW